MMKGNTKDYMIDMEVSNAMDYAMRLISPEEWASMTQLGYSDIRVLPAMSEAVFERYNVIEMYFYPTR